MISEELKSDVRALEKRLAQVQANARDYRSQLARDERAKDNLREKMGFRERYLWGGFGGDRDQVKEYRTIKQSIAAHNKNIESAKAEADGFNKVIVERLDGYLRVHAGDYRNLVIPVEAAKTLHEATASYLQKIDHALSEIDSTQGMETLDMFTKSKAISFMSYAANGDASSAIRAVKNASADFKQAVEAYNSDLEKVDYGRELAEIHDGIDLFMDFALGSGFDFSSLFTLSALGSAEDGMKQLRSQVSSLEGYIEKRLGDAKKPVTAYLERARLECR